MRLTVVGNSGGYRHIVGESDFDAGPLVTMQAGEHRWALDLAESFGGPGTEPDPVTAFLGSLCGCLLMSLDVTAKRRKLAVDGAVLDARCNQKGYVTKIELDLTVRSSASEEEVRQLVHGAERACFVRQLIRDDIDVRLSLTLIPSLNETPPPSLE